MITPTDGNKRFGDDEDIGRANKKRPKTRDIDTKVDSIVKGRAPKLEAQAPAKPRKILKRDRDDEGSIKPGKPGSLKRPNTASVTPKERMANQKKEVATAVLRTLQNLANIEVGPATISDIFKLENEYRIILSQPSFPQKRLIREQYNSVMLPLLEQAKDFIRHHPKNYSVHAAAGKGDAYLKGKAAIVKAKEEGRVLEANVDSAQEVILLPEENTVLKKMDAKAKEESHIADSLFHILSKKAVVGTFNIKVESEDVSESESVAMDIDEVEEVDEVEDVEYEAKPFVQMSLIKPLLKEAPEALEIIMQRLSPDAEYNAVLTGEIQMLDLHSANLAVVPVLPDGCDVFTDFSLGPDFNEKLPINQFLVKYLNGDIDTSQPVQYTEMATRRGSESTVLVQKHFSELPVELKSALECPWQFVIFDTDNSVGENNRLQFLLKDGVVQTMIPLRSCLLELDWKDAHLSDTNISRLLHSEEMDSRVNNWMARSDAPILNQLSPHARNHITELLQPRIAKFDLSAVRLAEENEYITIADLRARFVESVCVEESRENRALWRALESELNYDLHSRSHDATDGRSVIANQLFPRLTTRQQQAMHERQIARKEYLTSFNAFLHTNSSRPDLAKVMEDYINLPTTPITSSRKKEFLTLMQNRDVQRLHGVSSLSDVKELLVQETRPTYFNLMKAMYPLLADVYELTEIAEGKKEAPSCIGYFDTSLEEIIEKVKAKKGHDISVMNMVRNLEEEMKTANPSFYGFTSASESTSTTE